MLWTSASSWMMQRHSSMHSSQMYAEGPATSFFTSFWVFPQKEQNRMPPPPSFSRCFLGMSPSYFLMAAGRFWITASMSPYSCACPPDM